MSFNKNSYPKIIAGSGQSLSLTSGSAASFTNKVGSQTYLVAVKLAPAATAFIATVRISQAGTAATASTDYAIASSDPPQILGCNPGDKVNVLQSSGSTATAYLCELTY